MPDLSVPENSSPEYRQLLSLLPREDQQRFSETAADGGAGGLPFVAHLLAREHTRRLTRSTALRTCAALLTGGMIFGIPLLQAVVVQVMVVGLFLVIPLTLALVQYDPPGRLEQAAFAYLLHLDDRRSIGVLLERLHVGSHEDRQQVREALIRHLPHLSPEEASQLTPHQRTLFYGILDNYSRVRHVELQLAAIAALDRIGERYSLGILRHLSGGEAATKGEQAVRAAAQKCLYELQPRLDFGPPENIPLHLSTFHPPADSQISTTIVYADNLYALIALLPQLTLVTYRQILSEADRNRLYGLLSGATLGSTGYDTVKLYREIVRTLERVGDTRAMETLRQVALMEAPTDGTKQLRSAAKEALRVLRGVLEKEKVSRTLLRGSSAPDALPGELLRAAAPDTFETRPDELLRASTPEQERVTFKTNLASEESKAVLLQRTDDSDR